MNLLADRIKIAAKGRWNELIPDITGVSAKYFDGNYHPCPICSTGKDKFRFSNMDGDGSVICNTCCRDVGDGISAVMRIGKLPFLDACTALQKRLGIHASSGHREIIKRKGDYRVIIQRFLQQHKPGISLESVIRNEGAVHGVTDNGKIVDCLAMPVHDGEKITGYVYYALSGEPLHDKEGREMKVKMKPGTRAGWIGTYGLKKILNGTAEIVFKCEGVTDMLAVDTLLDNPRHVAITNHAGAGSLLPRELLEQLRGKRLIILHDNDDAGKRGAMKWAKETMGICYKVFALFPPGEGDDIRDWSISQGEDRDETRRRLFRLVRELKELTYEETAAPDEPPKDPESPELILDGGDPVAMAKGFTRRYRVLCWGDRFFRRERSGVWTRLEEAAFKATVSAFLDQYTERLFKEKHPINPNVERIKVSSRLIDEVTNQIRLRRQTAEKFRTNCLFKDPHGQARPHIEPETGTFDWILCENGLLKTNLLIAEDIDNALVPAPNNWFSVIQLGFPYVITASKTDRAMFESFLQQAFVAQDSIDMVQEFAGWILTSDILLQHFLYIHGEGATGKSSLMAVLMALCGPDGYSTVTVSEFEDPFNLGVTLGKALNVADEGRLSKKSENLLKSFTSGNEILHQEKYKTPINVRPSAKLVICSNDPPVFHDRSTGPWRRMLYACMDNVIPVEKRQMGLNYPETWIKTGQMPAILNWALGGFIRIKERGDIAESEESVAQKEEWKTYSRHETAFFNDNVIEEPGCTVGSPDIYKAYTDWCISTGNRPGTVQWLGLQLKTRFPKIKKRRESTGGRPRYYEGIRLRRAWDPLQPEPPDAPPASP